MAGLQLGVSYPLLDTSFFIRINSSDNFDLGVYLSNDEKKRISTIDNSGLESIITYLARLRMDFEGLYCIEETYKTFMYFYLYNNNLYTVAMYEKDKWSSYKQVSMDTPHNLPSTLTSYLDYSKGLKLVGSTPKPSFIKNEELDNLLNSPVSNFKKPEVNKSVVPEEVNIIPLKPTLTPLPPPPKAPEIKGQQNNDIPNMEDFKNKMLKELQETKKIMKGN